MCLFRFSFSSIFHFSIHLFYLCISSPFSLSLTHFFVSLSLPLSPPLSLDVYIYIHLYILEKKNSRLEDTIKSSVFFSWWNGHAALAHKHEAGISHAIRASPSRLECDFAGRDQRHRSRQRPSSQLGPVAMCSHSVTPVVRSRKAFTLIIATCG